MPIRGHSTDSDNSITLSPKRLCVENREDNIEEDNNMDAAKEVRELRDLLLELKDDIKSVKSSQDSITKTVSAKLDSFKKDLSDQVESIKETLYLEIGRIESRIHLIEEKLSVVEAKVEKDNDYPTDTTVVVINLKEDANEDIKEKCLELITQGLGLREMQPVRCCRLLSRDGRPGLVKLQLSSKEDKIRILKQKNELANTTKYKRVYVRSSQTHEERLLRLNFQALLDDMPGGSNFRIAGNGRLVKKLPAQPGSDESPPQQPGVRRSWQQRGQQGYRAGGQQQRQGGPAQQQQSGPVQQQSGPVQQQSGPVQQLPQQLPQQQQPQQQTGSLQQSPQQQPVLQQGCQQDQTGSEYYSGN